MTNPDSNQTYFEYLTARLDRGESKIVVVPTVAEIIREKLLHQDKVSVLDIGCFSGAMLNRIASEFPGETRRRIGLVGADSDRTVMKIGSEKYKDITFVEADLNKQIPLIDQYDIVVLSNVLHEVISPGVEIKGAVNIAFSRVTATVRPGGSLVLFDGIKPDKSDQSIDIVFVSPDTVSLYKEFSRRYKAIPISIQQTGDRGVRTTVGSLAALLTKARYMDKEYWPSESEQLYQYFTKDDFQRMIASNGLTINLIEPQHFIDEEISRSISSTIPKIEIPAKNVLIVARK